MKKQLLSVLLVSFFLALTPAGVAVAGIDGIVTEAIDVPLPHYGQGVIQISTFTPIKHAGTEEILTHIQSPATLEELRAFVANTKPSHSDKKFVALGSSYGMDGAKFSPYYDPANGEYHLQPLHVRWTPNEWAFLNVTAGARWTENPLIDKLDFSINGEEKTSLDIEVVSRLELMNFEREGVYLYDLLGGGVELFRIAIKESWNEETRQYYVSVRTTILSDFDCGDGLHTAVLVESVPQYGLNGEMIGWSSGPDLIPEICGQARAAAIRVSLNEALTELLETLRAKASFSEAPEKK
ncbi:MAG: hypothetical protein Q7S16_02840, partial [bacterium]|nr:hypothetical protein [bacterium]